MLALIFFLPAIPSRADTSIPKLTWTPRSDWVSVQSYGALGLGGTTDDTVAIQSALNYASAARYPGPWTVYFPPGTYNISQTLVWSTGTNWTGGTTGATMLGCGNGTTLNWTGTSGGTMFFSNGVSRARYLGLAWNGNGLAAMGMNHSATSQNCTESHVRHQNESFSNFTTAGIYSLGGGTSGTGSASEMMVWNCSFQSCSTGIVVGASYYNNYNWSIEGCEFDNNGIGINAPCGKTLILCNHFTNSSRYDIDCGDNVSQRIRRCTSIGSNAFFITGTVGFQRGGTPQVVQDCHIDSWKSTAGAIQLTNPGPHQVLDCVFTNPPNGNPPVSMMGTTTYPGYLTVSGNYCPTISGSNLVTASGTSGNSVFTVLPVPCGSLGSILTSASTQFLQSTWPTDVSASQIIDITGTNPVNGHVYNASKSGSSDASAAIQAAINDAAAANNDSIVYLPMGVYTCGTAINATGSNYAIQGSGLSSRILWTGGTSGACTLLTVATPQNIRLEQFMVETCSNSAATALHVTSTGTCSLTLDGVYYGQYPDLISHKWSGANPVPGVGGLLFDQLPAGSLVYLEQIDGRVVFNDCGPATILTKFAVGSQLMTGGATQPKTGFTGFDFGYYEQNYYDPNAPNYWDVQVNDNQDLVIGDLYQEHGWGHLQVNRGNGTSTGRVSIQSFKQESAASYPTIQINNYAGRLFYGPTWNASPSPIFTQTGTNAVDLIVTNFQGVSPTLNFSPACNYIQTQYYVSGSYGAMTDVLPTGWGTSYASGLDHFRQLASLDLQMRYGIGNVVLNPSAALDAVNPSPLTTPGYQPASWVVTNTNSSASGVRNATVTGTASPFGPGSQSIYLVDTTGTNAGFRLQVTQTTPTIPATEGAVFSFDFCEDPNAPQNDLSLQVIALGGTNTSCCRVHLVGSISSYIGGHDTILTSLSAGTWYRVQVVLPPPANGKSNATLYLSRWTASGPTTPVAYTIDGPPWATTGFNEVYINQTLPGRSTGLYLDNITLTTGDPLLDIGPEMIWKNQKFTAQDLADSTISGDLADPDGDGIVNLMEYALNLDPKHSDRISGPTSSTALVGGTTYLCFTHRKNSAASDLVYGYEQSTDMLGWTPATPTIVNSTYLDTFTSTIVAQFPVTNQQRLFIRLRVTKP